MPQLEDVGDEIWQTVAVARAIYSEKVLQRAVRSAGGVGFIPILSALGSLMGIAAFAITWSFFFSTPGVVKWSVSTGPIAWNLTGEFLYKDVVLLCVCVVLFLASLPKKVIPLRSN